MQSKTPEELAQLLTEAGFASSKPIVSCDESDLADLEKRFAVKLPEAYKHFMRVMGRQAGDFLNDCSWRYPLEFAHEVATDMLESDEERKGQPAFSLSDQTYVFLSRDNFFLFFDTTAGSGDPPVFIYEEGALQPRKFYDSFSEWLTVCITEDVRIEKKNQAAQHK